MGLQIQKTQQKFLTPNKEKRKLNKPNQNQQSKRQIPHATKRIFKKLNKKSINKYKFI